MAQKKLDRLASEDFSSSSDVRLLQPSDNDHDVHTLPLEVKCILLRVIIYS